MENVAEKLAKMHPLIMTEFHRINADMVEVLTLPAIQFNIMLFMSDVINCNLSDMARTLCVAPSWASENLDKLVKKGYLARKTSDEDRRKILISITKKGETLLKDYYKYCETCFSKLLDVIGDKDEKKKLLTGFQFLYDIALILKTKRESGLIE